MERARSLLNMLRSALWPAFAFAIIAFFGFYALFGSNGLLAWGDYAQRFETRTAELKGIEKQRAELANRVALLDPRRANPDMVDELVRRELGLAHPDEVIIPLR
jgi:cell division protein FtsB